MILREVVASNTQHVNQTSFDARTYTYTLIYVRHCEQCARVWTLIPLILRRHACCSWLSEMRHRRRRSSRNKKALRGCACIYIARVCITVVASTRPYYYTVCSKYRVPRSKWRELFSGDSLGCLFRSLVLFFVFFFFSDVDYGFLRVFILSRI